MKLSGDVAFRDGLGGTDHDWSHVVFSASSGIKITENITLTPGIFYQISMEDDVNVGNDFYGVLSTTIKY